MGIINLWYNCFYHSNIPSIQCSTGSVPVGVQCSLISFTMSLQTALVPWAFAGVGVHRLSLRLSYLGVFPFTLFHLPLNFIRVSSLRSMYLHPSVDPSLTDFFGEFPGLGLVLYQMLWSHAEAERGAHEAEISYQISSLAGVWTSDLAV